MSSKKLTILISILLVVTLIVVLASTVFTLKTVSFNFLNQRFKLEGYVTEDYLNNVDVPFGDSIFFVDKENLTEKLEKENAYLQVVGIETTFPNNIVIHASEREEAYAIKFDNDTYAITDKSLKILQFCDYEYLIRDGYLSPIVVDVQYEEVELSVEDYSVCDFIEIDHVTEVLHSIINAFEKCGYNVTSFKGFATNIVLRESGSFMSKDDGEYDLAFVKTVEITTKYGIKLSINNAYSNLDTKVALSITAYEMEHDKHHTTGEILVFEQSDRLVARYRQSD